MDFKPLEQKIEKATKKALIELFEKHKDEEIYAFALYSDEGAMTVCPSMNTVAFLNDLNEEERDSLAYYKFEPAEWKYEGIGAEEDFEEICSELRTELEKNNYDNEYENEEVFTKFQNQLFASCISVLKKLKEEDFFINTIGKDILLMFSVSDYQFEKTELKKNIATLNDNEYREEYLTWIKSWGN